MGRNTQRVFEPAQSKSRSQNHTSSAGIVSHTAALPAGLQPVPPVASGEPRTHKVLRDKRVAVMSGSAPNTRGDGTHRLEHARQVPSGRDPAAVCCRCVSDTSRISCSQTTGSVFRLESVPS
ncbi:hypothetical protein VTH82DRAFT_4480 [Thermothelomyces myriococcoides]